MFTVIKYNNVFSKQNGMKMNESCCHGINPLNLCGIASANRVAKRVHQRQSFNLHNAFRVIARDIINKGYTFESSKNEAAFQFDKENSNKDRKGISLKYRAFARHRFLYKARTDSLFHIKHNFPARLTV